MMVANGEEGVEGMVQKGRETRQQALTRLPQFERRDPGLRAAPGCKSEPQHTGDRNGACSADQVH
jgi:hypothetical protein